MNNGSLFIYEFRSFRLDPEKLVLYYGDELIKDVAQKAVEVLIPIVQNGDEVTSYEEIISNVWPEDTFGADSLRINQYVSKLKKTFARYYPEEVFIENIKGRGYRFVTDVNKIDRHQFEISDTSPGAETRLPSPTTDAPTVQQRTAGGKTKYLGFGLGLLALVLLGSAGWMWFQPTDEEVIRGVVRESQLYESLNLYKDPAAVREEDLDRFWLRASEGTSNFDRQRISNDARKLATEGLYYGPESKCEQLEFQWIALDEAKTTATVRTLEKWFISVYKDGAPVKNRTVGPYFVNYILKNVDGRWLIERSTTARVSRPIPHLDDIEAVTQPAAGQQFLVRLTGKDIEPETVYLEVIGPGCPDAKPCKVPNTALLEKAKLSDTVLDNVPLTLASGDFRIAAHNGESQPSNYLYLTVP